MTEQQRNTMIERFLKLRENLKKNKNLFTENYDGKNQLSKLSKMIQIFKDSNIIDEEQKNTFIKSVEADSEEAEHVIKLISEQIDVQLNKLGYAEKEIPIEPKINIGQELKNENDLVTQYEKVIQLIEKMIVELEQTMSEVDAWINKISENILCEKPKKEQKKEEESVIDKTIEDLVNLN